MGVFAKGFIAGTVSGIAAVFVAAMASVLHEDYVCRKTFFGSANLDDAEEDKNESGEQEQENSTSEVADAGSDENLEDA